MNRRDARAVLAAVLGTLVACDRAPASDPNTRESILLVSIDTLRADSVGTYGSARPTPVLDALARESIVFRNAYAPAPWTIPSHASLFTGLAPRALGVNGRTAIPDAAPMLAEALAGAGYATGARVNTTYVGSKYGFDRGMDEFSLHPDRKDVAQGVDAALEFARRMRGRPSFFFLHVFDVHGPYTAPAPWTDRYVSDALPPDDALPFLRRLAYQRHLRELPQATGVAWVRARYDAGVARVDAELERLFEGLRAAGAWDDTWVFVTSDHGEAFYEHRVWIGHGLFLYEPELRVPLIVKPPARVAGGRAIDVPVSLIDLGPTMRAIAGLEPDPAAQGRSLRPVLEGEASLPADHAVFGDSPHLGDAGFVRVGRWKYVEDARASVEPVLRNHLKPEPDVRDELRARLDLGPKLFDLETDPAETSNRIDDHPDVAARLAARLAARQAESDAIRARLRARTARPPPVDLTPDEKRQLRELGYGE